MKALYLYIAILAFALGIFLRTIYPIELPLIFGIVLFAFLCIALARARNSAGFVYAGLGILCLSLGLLRFDHAESRFGVSALASDIGREVSLVGLVVREPDARERFIHLYVRTDDDVLLVLASRHLDVRYGDSVAVKGRLERPTSFTTEFGRTFDYPGYLKARGVEYRVSFANVEVLERGGGNFFLTALFSVKRAFTDALSTVLPEPQYGLAVGLLLGIKTALGEELETAFRKTGIIHIVVLSGYNVMLVVAFVSFLLAAFLPIWPRTAIGLIAIASFALLVGLSATVVRASIMASLFLLAYALGRPYEVLRGLLMAAAVMLVINPYLLVYDVGFQLSFLATLGLIVVMPHFEVLLSRVPGRLGIKEFGIATVATQIAVLPLLLYQVGELSVVAVVVNMLVLPMVPVAMLLTFATGLAALAWPAAASLLTYPAALSLSYIIVAAEWFAALPFSAFTVPEFGFYWVPLMYAAIGYLVYLRYGAPRSGAPETVALAGWTIVEESDFEEKVSAAHGYRKGAPLRGAPPATPVFFRPSTPADRPPPPN